MHWSMICFFCLFVDFEDFRQMLVVFVCLVHLNPERCVPLYSVWSYLDPSLLKPWLLGEPSSYIIQRHRGHLLGACKWAFAMQWAFARNHQDWFSWLFSLFENSPSKFKNEFYFLPPNWLYDSYDCIVCLQGGQTTKNGSFAKQPKLSRGLLWTWIPPPKFAKANQIRVIVVAPANQNKKY